MKRAVIVGASSGIGEELARVMAADGWHLGLTARRRERLDALAQELGGDTVVQVMDVARHEEAAAGLTRLLEQMSPVDVVVLNAGVGLPNYKLRLERDLETISINVTGFVATLHAAYHYFESQGKGHIVGISSVASLRGGYGSQAYSASKAFISNYMEAVRIQAHKRKLDIAVTDVRPGYVHTPLTEGQKGMFWVSGVEEAARQIYRGMARRKRCLYVTRKWRLVAAVMAHLPEAILRKM